MIFKYDLDIKRQGLMIKSKLISLILLKYFSIIFKSDVKAAWLVVIIIPLLSL